MPRVAADIAQRLLQAGRPEDAAEALDATDPDRWRTPEWEDVRLAVLEALGRDDEAQAYRWACFERFLAPKSLRDYLRRLPEFDDVEAEDKALDLASRHHCIHTALDFLVNWPALDRAAQVVLARGTELDGDLYHILTPAAEALAAKHPLAATVVLRAMIDFSLGAGRSSRYGHATRHLMECASLATLIDDFGSVPPHADYVAGLEKEHGRKTSFWSRLTS